MAFFAQSHDFVINDANFIDADNLQVTNRRVHVERSFNATGNNNIIAAPSFDHDEERTTVTRTSNANSTAHPSVNPNPPATISPERALLLQIHTLLDQFLFPDRYSNSTHQPPQPGAPSNVTLTSTTDTQFTAGVSEDAAGNQILRGIASTLERVTVAPTGGYANGVYTNPTPAYHHPAPNSTQQYTPNPTTPPSTSGYGSPSNSRVRNFFGGTQKRPGK
ncbi:hypothetical protein NP233_g12712 [Leucocoprinus birnbaumii]|uniref:Uncharacterized protein n=1 Tax=Leucocoprinus birnbaumii TaxID=56174 RepID=A0AAD5VE49_9AGAR|nr:hypothetical protein NP233_g12712 [Leucocoprinus birnbaumii]